MLKLMSDGRVERDSLKVQATDCSAGFDKLGVRRCRRLNLNPYCELLTFTFKGEQWRF